MGTPNQPLAGPFRRLHAALMPDYNRPATAYWWTMVMLGAAAIAWALSGVATLDRPALLQTAAGTLLAVLAGFFPVRIPRSKNSFVAGEVFIFLLLLMHGAQAATLAAAGEAAVGAYRSSKRWTSRIVSPCLSGLAMMVSARLLETVFALLTARGLLNPGTTLLVAMLVAVVYFGVNTVLISMVMTLKRSERFDLRAHLANFGSVGVAYAASASMAALLFVAVEHAGISVLFGALPVVALLLTTVHFLLRQQDADEQMRRAQAEAGQREAAQMSRHLEALAASEQRFHAAFTHASIGMALVTYDGRVLQANGALAAVLGARSADALADRVCHDVVHPDDLPALARCFESVRTGANETFSVELRCRRTDGSTIWAALHGGAFAEPGSDAPCLIVQVQDVSARRRAEEQLSAIAFHDSLTGLPNRGRLHHLLAQALDAARTDPNAHFGVMFLDFDRFKLINDSLGHSAGDEFLAQVSRRIQHSVRPGDVVARLGGDEFAVLVHRLERLGDATHLAERLLQALREPLVIGGMTLTPSASIGITVSRLGYRSAEEMLRDADIAMYRAKSAGKARYAVFDAAQHTQVSERVRLEADLRDTLQNGGLGVAYQPLFDLTTGALLGFEALARWTHPTLGPVSPASFVPIAEETGLIVELTDHVLMTACRQLRAWQERDASLARMHVQVNLSANDLSHASLPARVGVALRATGLPANRLTLELTENILMQRVDSAMSTLAALRDLGVGIAIDDFGTGYSSLSYLSRLPIDSLKIDRSFVSGMGQSPHDAEIVRAIVSLGDSLGKKVVAEGIESDSQFAQLRALGCKVGQGFHLSRPLDLVEVDHLLDCVLADAQAPGAFGAGVMPVVRH